jgi:hypothetical protein
MILKGSMYRLAVRLKDAGEALRFVPLIWLGLAIRGRL